MTQGECVDQMWDLYSSKVLKTVCILDNHLTLEQLCNHEFPRTQDKGDLLAPMLFAMSAEEKPPAGKQEGDKWSRRQRIVEDARGRSSRLLRFCSMRGKTGDEHA